MVHPVDHLDESTLRRLKYPHSHLIAAHHDNNHVRLQGMANVQLVLDKNHLVQREENAAYHNNQAFVAEERSE